ncbi:hypothetical protein POM88_052536 [Heracleum sosnowskyi]|uniref:MYB-CC type transcription factor LHEQLE-containing domain-containing protein n=1 Tax=Heracleum sosnowskyi TaxID=360622 RepID=A0AAD8LY19_9APIA|nr:hypothetical protein POM88_052536 [Heracleum sosnowskyi]
MDHLVEQKLAGVDFQTGEKQKHGSAGRDKNALRTSILDEAAIVFSTLSFSGKLNRTFDIVIIDEAAQAVLFLIVIFKIQATVIDPADMEGLEGALVQRHLQLRIEAQGKYLQTVLEKAQDTLGKQNLGTVGLEAAKVQLSELVSKVSTKSLNSAFSGMTEVPSFCPQQIQAKQPTDCSMQSFLTSYEVSQQGQEIQNRWSKDLKDNRNFISPMVQDTDKAYEMQLHASDLSMRVGVQGGNWNSNSTDVQEKMKDRDLDANLFYPSTHSVKQEDVKSRQGFQISRSAPKLDLNIHDDSDTCCISLGSEAPPSFDSSCFE